MARRILLADDSVTAQNMGRRILSDAGYEVITVNNGSAALKKVSEQAPDVIVLDVYMPGYGGLEVCQRLKEVQETARIPILLTVGKLEPFKPDEVRRVRADAFIVKPFEATELLAALTKLEDKIVPQSDGTTRKPRSLTSEPGSGEEDSGWKNRLSIPPGGKGRTPEALEADDFGQKPSIEASKQEAPAVAGAVVESSTKIESTANSQMGQAAETVAPAAEVKEEVRQNPPSQETSSKQVAAEEPTVKETPAGVPTQSTEANAAAHAAPVEAQRSTGPRWVAESVALSTEDASLPLDREMEKVRAADAAYVAGVDNNSSVKLETQGSISVVKETTSVSGPGEPAAESESAAVSANTGSTHSESAAPAELAVVAAPADSNPEEQPVAAVSEVTIPEKQEAYAAAASVGSSSSEVIAVEARATAVAAETESAQGKQQLAAAWEQWQNVRETVLNSPVAEQITEVAAASLKNAQTVEQLSSPSDSPTSPSNPTAIASIVDSVLAELKPKLVEEIAKKLGDEKDKNKK